MAIEGQISFIKGGMYGLAIQAAQGAIDMAVNAVEKEKNNLKNAMTDYNVLVSARAVKYRQLSVKLQEAGIQSGLNPAEADRVALAVQAKPLMELARSACDGV
jgi:hypothetical protein